MQARPAIHPSADVLTAFGQGKLDHTAAGAVMTHLDNCPQCCQAVASATGDSFLQRLRAARARSGTSWPGTRDTTAGDAKGAGPAPTTSYVDPSVPPELREHPQYKVVRELGRGGMGVVYLAHNKLMDRPEVLKVMNKALLDRAGAVERFLREIRSAAMLSHPNIATAYTALQVGDLLVFAMQYVEGEDLAKVVKSRGPLPVVNACYYVQQAALGLQHAFEKGMVHRDLKPQNLILGRDGKKHVVKVLDFGLAKVLRENHEDTGLTGEGRMLGTPDYVAPEQIRDAATADIRADIYSLGCTLYCLLAGHSPFKGKSLWELLQAHQAKEAEPLNKIRPDVPAELAAAVQKMMAKDPGQRYQTPIEVAQAFLPFIKPAGKEAFSTSPPSRPSAVPVPATKQKRLLRIGGPAILLLTLLGLWAGGLFKVRTKEGILVVEVNEPNPEVYVDGEQVTVAWDNGGKKAQIHVKSGTRKVEVKKDGFKAYGEEVTLEDGEQQIIVAKLDKSPPSSRNPPGALQARTLVQANELLDADPWQVEELTTRLEAQRDQVVPLLDAELDKKAATESSEQTKESRAMRQANAAAALLRLGQETRVWPLLATGGDMRLRTYLLDRLMGMRGLSPAVAKRLEEETAWELQLNGETSHVATSLYFNQPAPCTFEALVTLDTVTPGFGQQAIVGDYFQKGIGLVIDDVAGPVCTFFVHDGRSYRGARSPERISEGKRVHLAGIFDPEGHEVRLFVGGALQKWKAVIDGFKPSAFPVMVGANAEPRGLRFPFRGRIKEVRCSRGVLYTKDFDPPQRLAANKNTLLLLHLDVGEGAIAYDSSGNHHHGLIHDGKWVKSSE